MSIFVLFLALLMKMFSWYQKKKPLVLIMPLKLFGVESKVCKVVATNQSNFR